MKSIAKSIAKIANQLDAQGASNLADKLDSIIVAIAEADFEMGEPTVTEEPAGSASRRKSDSEARQMLQAQQLFNAYIKVRDAAVGVTYAEPGSAEEQVGGKVFQKAVPENGKVGDQATWTAINSEFGWKPGKDYRNYQQLLKLIQGEIDKLKAAEKQSETKDIVANATEIMSLWAKIIGMEYDPQDAAQYKVSDFRGLLNKLQNLPPQRGPTDALHRKADELAYLAKEIMKDPASSGRLVDWLKFFMSNWLRAVETESED